MTNLKRAMVVASVLSQFVVSESAPKVRQASTRSPQEIAATTPTTGTLVVKFNITLGSSLPKGGVINCDASAEVSESSTNTSFFETGEGFAKFVAPVWTCTVTIHYSWLLATPNMDQVSLSETAGIVEARSIAATNANTATVVTTDIRQSDRSGGTLSSVPLTGTTTTETVNFEL